MYGACLNHHDSNGPLSVAGVHEVSPAGMLAVSRASNWLLQLLPVKHHHPGDAAAEALAALLQG
jgi:hypothetical protein